MTTPFDHLEQSTERLRERQEAIQDLLECNHDEKRISNLTHELGYVALELRLRSGEKIDERI